MKAYGQSSDVAPTAERFQADMASVYWHAELPIGGTSQFAQWCVFNLAKEHDVIVLAQASMAHLAKPLGIELQKPVLASPELCLDASVATTCQFDHCDLSS